MMKGFLIALSSVMSAIAIFALLLATYGLTSKFYLESFIALQVGSGLVPRQREVVLINDTLSRNGTREGIITSPSQLTPPTEKTIPKPLQE